MIEAARSSQLAVEKQCAEKRFSLVFVFGLRELAVVKQCAERRFCLVFAFSFEAARGCTAMG